MGAALISAKPGDRRSSKLGAVGTAMLSLSLVVGECGERHSVKLGSEGRVEGEVEEAGLSSAMRGLGVFSEKQPADCGSGASQSKQAFSGSILKLALPNNKWMTFNP